MKIILLLIPLSLSSEKETIKQTKQNKTNTNKQNIATNTDSTSIYNFMSSSYLCKPIHSATGIYAAFLETH